MSTSYGLIIELLKEWKTAEVENHSASVYYLYKWLGHLHFHMFTAAMFSFSARFLNIRKPRIRFHLLWWAGPPGMIFYRSGPAHLLSWLGMMNPCWLGSMQSEIFFQMKFIIFQGFPTKQTEFLPGQTAPYNQLLTQRLFAYSRMLFCIECWSYGFETSSQFFSECRFIWLQYFFL